MLLLHRHHPAATLLKDSHGGHMFHWHEQMCPDMWGLGTGAIQSTDRSGIWASLAVIQGSVWGCLVVGTKAATCMTGTLTQ